MRLSFIMRTNEATLLTVLMLRTGNMCRSHRVEGVVRAAACDLRDAPSGVAKPVGFGHPLSMWGRGALGIDFAGHESKRMPDIRAHPVEPVRLVRGNADPECPLYSGQVNRHRRRSVDPAEASGTDAKQAVSFHRLRDESRRTFAAFAHEQSYALKTARSGGAK